MIRYAKTNYKKSKENGKNYYLTTYYKKVEKNDTDMYFISTQGDRLDNLAFQFYGQSSLWWYIAKINNLTSMNIPAGINLRIPQRTV